MNYMETRLSALAGKLLPHERLPLLRALDFAEQAHADQTRCSGEPYIVHPAAVATLLYYLTGDQDLVIAGLLHDCLEDSDVTPSDLRRFGRRVTRLVIAVSKPGFGWDPQRSGCNLGSVHRWLNVAYQQDTAACLLKIADRLHNVRTLGFLPDDRQRSVALETRFLFVPLARDRGLPYIADEFGYRLRPLLKADDFPRE